MDGVPARSALLENIVGVAVGGSGTLYIAESYALRVRKVDASGLIRTVAGSGGQIYNGDGIPATAAAIDVRGIAVDQAGNLYIADGVNHRVRKVSTNGVVTTVAGNGSRGSTGDGGLATSARLEFPTEIAVSQSGSLFIGDGARIRKVAPNGVISTVAGTGEYGFSGDGGPATSAMLSTVSAIAVDGNDNLYIVDSGNGRVRKVSSIGTISTIVGGGPFRSDPVALNVKMLQPLGVGVDSRGNVYVSGADNLVRIVSREGMVAIPVGNPFDAYTVIGGGPGYSGDGGPAATAELDTPVALAFDAVGNLYIADNGNGRVRKVTLISTPPTLWGKGALAPFRTYPVGSFTQHVAVADVTGDGRDDALLTTTTWSGPYAEPGNDMRLWLFVQKPDGSLAAPLKYPYAGDLVGGRSGTGLVTTDLNNDGRKDVVVGTLYGITIYLGTANGLAAGVSFAGIQNAEVIGSLTSLDVDLDGNLDIVASGGGGSEGGSSPDFRYGITTFYGNGHGGIARMSFQPRPDEYGWKFLRARDMNGDGYKDLTSGWTETGTGFYRGGVEIALHDGVGGFRATQRFHPAYFDQGWGNTYAAGDFDSDGRTDIILSLERNAPEAQYSWFRQLSDGRLVETKTWPAFDVPAELLAADMNGDQRDDLVVVHAGWSSIGVHFQSRRGELDPEVKYYTVQSGNPRSPALAVGDLNSDGCNDIAMADYNHGLVVLQSEKCMFARRGARPLLPPRPPQAGVSADQVAEQVWSAPAATRSFREATGSRAREPTSAASPRRTGKVLVSTAWMILPATPLQISILWWFVTWLTWPFATF